MTRRISDLDGHDPYALLEISPAATAEEIHRAHRRAIRDAHPDMATGDEGRTKLLNIAREVLLDPDLRAEVDRSAIREAGQTGRADAAGGRGAAGTRGARAAAHGQTAGPVYRPVAGSGVGLGVWALIAAVPCFPVGGFLGVMALSRKPKPKGLNKICAVLAVCYGGAGLLCCVGYLVLIIFGSTLATAS